MTAQFERVNRSQAMAIASTGKPSQKAILKPIDIDLTGDDTDDEHQVLCFNCSCTQHTPLFHVQSFINTVDQSRYVFLGAMCNASKPAGSPLPGQLWTEVQHKPAATREPQDQAAQQAGHRCCYPFSALWQHHSLCCSPVRWSKSCTHTH